MEFENLYCSIIVIAQRYNKEDLNGTRYTVYVCVCLLMHASMNIK